MKSTIRAFAAGLAAGISSELSSSKPKRKRTENTQTYIDRSVQVDMTEKSWCPFCRSASAHYNSKNQLVCRKCRKNHHA